MKIPNIIKNITLKINEGVNQARDPICGMRVDLNKTKYKSTYEGREYGFCSESCKAEFDKNPFVFD